MTDLLIENGWIVDGTGAPRYRGRVAVTGGRIEAVGESTPAGGAETLDADGLVVAPGFIDIHTHSELALLADPQMPFKVRQGVTTEVLGNCGFSAAPLANPSADLFRELCVPVFGHAELDWDWDSLAGYQARLERGGMALNAASLVGHGALRAAVMGFERRAPTEGELKAMCRMVAEAMDAGALGLSTGLIYPPGCYAETAELVALSEVSGRHGGIYATHLRDQSDRLLEAVQEAIAIGQGGGLPVQISHHKCAGAANRGKVRESLALLDGAKTGGVQPGSDMYPYLAGSSTLVSLFPPWAVEGGVEALLARLAEPEPRARICREFESGLPGWENRVKVAGWENIYVSSVVTDANRSLVGRQLREIAQDRGQPPEQAVCDLLLAEGGRVGYIGYNSSEADLETVLRHPRTSIGSDGLDVGERPHPRLYGTFPRVLGEYVRRRGILTLEEAVHKMTGLTAAQAGLKEVGLLQPGYRADLVLFDPETVEDRATFEVPRQFPAGIPHVFVGGTAVVRHERLTGNLPGQVLRRGGGAQA
ncbi:MAG: D-aminoacylase [SAR324 cluster bacterium]|nr:D-aminoacylase [SAR324 cluster bacterium]